MRANRFSLDTAADLSFNRGKDCRDIDIDMDIDTDIDVDIDTDVDVGFFLEQGCPLRGPLQKNRQTRLGLAFKGALIASRLMGSVHSVLKDTRADEATRGYGPSLGGPLVALSRAISGETMVLTILTQALSPHFNLRVFSAGQGLLGQPNGDCWGLLVEPSRLLG